MLLSLGHEVVIIDEGSQHLVDLGVCVAPATIAFLQRCFSESFRDGVGFPISTFRSSWGSDVLDARDFSFWAARPGLLIHGGTFLERMLAVVRSEGGQVMVRSRLRTGSFDGLHWCLTYSNEGVDHSLTVDFVVEATGRASRSVLQPDNHRTFIDGLICCTLASPQSSSNISEARIAASRNGWWYMVGSEAAGGRISFFTDADLLSGSGDNPGFLYEEYEDVTDLMPSWVANSSWSEARKVDARTSFRSLIWRDNWLAIGDAAWTLDPLSGNGVDRAVKDGSEVATAIDEWVRHGSQNGVRSYARRKGQRFLDALDQRKRYYAMESRWPNSPFWERRARQLSNGV